MLFNKHVVTIIYTLFIAFFIWIFCTDPTKPSFDKAAEFENDSIMTFGKPIVDSSFAMYVIADGTGQVIFRWFKNDSIEVSRSVNDTLILSPLSLSDSGSYKCIVSNEFGSDTGASYLLKITSLDSDTIEPEITLLYPVDGFFSPDSLLQIALIIKDPSGIALVTIHGDTVNSTDSIYSHSIKLSLGENLIAVIAEDSSDYKNRDTLYATFTYDPLFVDTIPPKIELISPDDGFVSPDPIIKVTVKITDSSGVSQVAIQQDTVVSNDSIYSSNVNLVLGENQISIIATNNSYNYNCDTLHATLTYDTIGNNPPQWVSDTLHANAIEGTFFALNLLDSCTDPDNDTLTFHLVADEPPSGDSIVQDTLYTITPTFEDAGVYNVKINAFDGVVNSSAILKLTIENVNRPPRFKVEDSLPKLQYKVEKGEELIIKFEAEDPDGDSLTIFLANTSLPDSASIVFNDSVLTWLAKVNTSGQYDVKLSVSDGSDIGNADIKVYVGDINIPPVISVTGFIMTGETDSVLERKTYICTVSVSDLNAGDTPELLPVVNAPYDISGTGTGSYNLQTGIFTYTPAFSVSNGNAPYTFSNITFYAEDDSGATDTFAINMVVLDSNSAPVWNPDNDAVDATEGLQITYNFSTAFKGDNEGDRVLFSVPFGQFNIDTTIWSWTPLFDDAGVVNLQITASDSLDHTPPAKSVFTLAVTVADSVKPVILSNPSVITYKSINLTWTQSDDADFLYYRVYKSLVPGVTNTGVPSVEITDINTTYCTIDTLDEDTNYYFRVFVYNSNGTVYGSNEVQARTNVLDPPVITVTSLTIVNDSTSETENASNVIPVSGTASSDADIKGVIATIGGVSVNVTGTTNWSFNVPDTYKKQWNKVDVTATDDSRKETTKTFYLFYKPDLAVPALPVLTNVNNRSITVSWTGVADCDRHLVYRSDIGNSGPYTIIKDTISTSLKDTSLHIGTTYWYKIQGYYTVTTISDSSDQSSSNNATTQNWFEYTYNFGGDEEIPRSIAKTTDGGYVIAGEREASGIDDIFLCKINKSGDVSWSKTIQTGGNNTVYSVVQATDGGFVIGTNRYPKTYLVKTDSDGNFIDEFSPDTGNGASLTVAPDGGYIICGHITESPDPWTFVGKLNTNGTVAWRKFYNIREPDRGAYGRDISKTGDGGYVAVSQCQWGGIFLSRLDYIGDTTWADTFYASGGIVVDPGVVIQSQSVSYNYYIAGFEGVNNNDAVLVKIDSSIYSNKHYVQWKKNYDNNGGREFASDVKEISSGGFVLTGSSGNYVYFVKTNASGDLVHSNTFGDGVGADGMAILEASNGGFIILATNKVNTKFRAYIIKTNANGDIGS